VNEQTTGKKSQVRRMGDLKRLKQNRGKEPVSTRSERAYKQDGKKNWDGRTLWGTAKTARKKGKGKIVITAGPEKLNHKKKKKDEK